MRIYINNELFDFSKRGKKAGLETDLTNAWKYLNEIYNLEEGNSLKIKFVDKIGTLVEQSNGALSTIRKIMVYPRKVVIPRRTKVIDENGEVFEIILADKREVKSSIDGEKIYKYFPERNIAFKGGSMTLTKSDRELITYMYLFSSVIETKPKETSYSILNPMTPMLKFDNPFEKAKAKISDIKTQAAVISIVEDLSSEQIVAFARILGINNPSRINRTVLNDKVFELTMKSQDNIDNLKVFSSDYKKPYFEAVNVLNAALEQGVVTVDRTSKNAIYTIEGDSEPVFKTSIKIDKENFEEFCLFMSKHTDLLGVVSNKLK